MTDTASALEALVEIPHITGTELVVALEHDTGKHLPVQSGMVIDLIKRAKLAPEERVRLLGIAARGATEMFRRDQPGIAFEQIITYLNVGPQKTGH